MDQFQTINIEQTQTLLLKPEAILADTRDSQSFAQGHVEEAFPLNNDTIVEFMNEVEFEQPILVMCYHGISSQNVAQYLINQGYSEVYSVDGGIEAWRRAGLPLTVSK
ncbi:thiosulfate sulfurtransferase GlpE [Vibrio kyushuensis]|uniref:thiosulfate sulfurtransferase GlpE n=1 Tax=Vibrio kyushuensis TaxID=2910249 RepID=UPI003D0EF67E